ncbi:type II toxin-antitoxin system ParD family antitoxin [Pseudoalteromonas sp. B5MOD-1]|uniref:ribbon-helix-helix domain-containing protein n=1 Tax=Pseudoalteromonas TaxID=53246 RepID=UPI0007864D2B|nr:MULTISPECIES: type II toxin-antitoxin system ParD family antitoxin [Gammaproteobacteria]MBC7010398.1 type II toxin-antitoxin system ParD family antitoxin [Pseudoalteromonas sp. BZK2]MCF7518831.1 type II toxin-antitoxin system ParD family antitoxin [Pseudoalteromonas sp. L21]MCK8130848.1 type II toxin-antitoxin system ParD family antitoxin [Pseudoalteromonas sp. 2CM39R]MCO7207232.1 type II toxin-antitoxin system ParD family antitoxin [Pseudoalteromonas sp. CnMc7-37]RZF82517.1 type II toxin-a|tara:strand:+ start:1330 stop:1587 length:258 start_codon:yes stop_codon:yes gene_type:complete
MAMVKKSITVTAQQEKWMQAQLASGNYASDSELLRDLIRKEQMRASEIEAIRMKLIEAEKSGLSDKSPNQMLASFKEEASKDGKL